MKPFILNITLLLILLPAISSAETIYQTKDAQGNPVFSDSPQKGAKEINLPPLQSYTAPEKNVAPKPTTKKTEKKQFKYTQLSIVEPQNEATIWSNPGIITGQASITPKIRMNDSLVILVDGKPATKVKGGSSFSLQGIDRGEHQLTAEIIDSKNQVLISSNPVTIYLHKASIRTPAPPVINSGNN